MSTPEIVEEHYGVPRNIYARRVQRIAGAQPEPAGKYTPGAVPIADRSGTVRYWKAVDPRRPFVRPYKIVLEDGTECLVPACFRR